MNEIDIQRLAERVVEQIEAENEAKYRELANELAALLQTTIAEFVLEKTTQEAKR